MYTILGAVRPSTKTNLSIFNRAFVLLRCDLIFQINETDDEGQIFETIVLTNKLDIYIFIFVI